MAKNRTIVLTRDVNFLDTRIWAPTGDAHKIFTNGLEDGQRRPTLTNASGMNRHVDICDFIANRPIYTAQYEICLS